MAMLGASLVMLTFVAPAQQGVTVRAGLSPSTVSVGQEGSYTITVSGAGAVDEFPRKIEAPGLEVIFKRTARRFKIVQGRSVQRFTLNYSVSAQREGRFTIPAQSVAIGNSEFKVNAVTLTVRRGVPVESAQKPVLRIELPKTEVFVGEVIPIALVVEIPAGAQFRPMEHPKLNPEGFALKRFAVPLPGGHSDGWAEYRYGSSLSAIAAGELELGPAELAFSVSFPPRRGGRTPFSNRWSTKNYRMQTESLSVTVKPLPTEGMPASFHGAVGDFTMEVSASPLELQVNDPLMIDSKITGTGNFDRLTAPVITNPDGWKLQRPREYLENRSNGLEPGTTAFSQVAQPLRALTELPPLEFSFFDPATEEYRTLRSEPIALNIRPDASPLGRVEGKDFTTPEASLPEEELGDILTIFLKPGKLRRADGSDAPIPLACRTIVVLSVLTVLGIAATGLARRARERSEQRARDDLQCQHRSSADLLLDLIGGGKAAKQFYAVAGDCIRALIAERGQAVSRAVVASEELSGVVAQAQFYLYGSSTGKAAEAVNASERERVITLLQNLAAQSAASAEPAGKEHHRQ